MLTVVADKQNSKIISIPAEQLEKLGFKEGDEVEFALENNEIILRSTGEIERKKKFEDAKNKIFDEWHDVFVELAKGADDENTVKSEPSRTFVIYQNEDKKYEFVLRESDGKIIFKSAAYPNVKAVRSAYDSLKKLIYSEYEKNLDYSVEDRLETV